MVAPTNSDAPRKDDTVVFEDGVYRPGYKDAVQPRGWTGAAWDTGIDVAKTAIDVLQSPVTLLRDATAQPSGGDVDAAAMAQGVQHAAIDAKKWLGRHKTAYGQEQDELAKTQEADEKGWMREAGEALVSSAPAAAAAYFGGPLGAAAYGAVSSGTTGLNLEEQLRDLPPDALSKTDKYKQYRERGMSDEQAKQRLYADMRDAGTILPDLVANTVFGGVAGRAIAKLGSRGVAQSMRDRILKNVALDVPEGVVGGALSGSATEYSRQQGLVQAGLQEELDYDAIQKAGIDIARPVGVITGAIAGGRSLRRPGGLSQHEQAQARQRTGWEAQQAGRDVQTRMAESAPPAKEADELGMDLRLVAANNLDAGKPQRAEMPGPEQAQAGQAGTAARAPWSPVEPAVPPEAPAVPPVAPGVTPAGTEAAPPPAVGGTPVEPPGAAVRPVEPAVAAGVETPQQSLGRDIKVVQEELQNLTQQRRSLDAASPDQKASLEWREESQRIDEELARVTQEAAAPSPIPGAAAPPAAAAPHTSTPAAAAGVEAKPPAGAAAPGEAVAKAKMTLDELKARAADHAQTPTIDALNAAIKEYKDQHGLKKLPEHSAITKAWSEGKTKATKAAGEQKQAEQKAAREAKKTRAAEEKLQRKQAKVEKQGEAEQVGLAQKQAKGYAKLAREQAQKVTQAGKAPETKDAAKAKAPGPEKTTAAAETKPAGDTAKAEPPPPPDEKADPDLIRRKLGLKPLGAQAVTHGKAAEPVIAKLVEAHQLKAAQAWDPQTRRQTKDAKTKARSEAKAAAREDQVTMRETTAKATLEDHKPGANYVAELDSVEAVLKQGVTDAKGKTDPDKVAAVKSHVAQVVADVREMVADYKDRINNLAGGKDHPVFRYATGKGFEVTKAGKEKAASAARSGKGEYHNFLGEMGNFLDKVERALKKGDETRARELTLRYLENSRRVREGDIAEVTKTRRQASDSVGEQKKKNAPSGAQVELREGELAKIKFDEEQAKEADRRTAAELTKEEAHKRGMPWPEKDAKGKITRWIHPDEHGKDPGEWVGGVKLARDPHRTTAIRAAIREYWEKDLNGSRPLNWAEISSIARQLGEKIRTRTLGQDMEPHRPEHPLLQVIFDRVYDMVKDMPSHTISPELAHIMSEDARAFYMPTEGMTFFRPDTHVPRTVFHEALHAATARALHGSERLQHLVTRIQKIVERTYKHSPTMQQSLAYDRAIAYRNEKNELVYVNQHEFLSELFTRPDVMKMVQDIRLRERDLRDLKAEGYAVDKGKGLLGTLWDTFLKILKFDPERPGGLKVMVDMLQDTFEREMQFRARDTALGIREIGIMKEGEIWMLAAEDPVHGTAAHKAMMAGNHAEAARSLVAMADKMGPKTADASIRYLQDVNEQAWGSRALPDRITPMSNPEAVRSGVDTFMDSRFGNKTKDWGWQFNNKFATPIRKFVSGMQYTNDIGRNLEAAFQTAIQPLKDAWSKRENFAQKYMDESGANKLIDDIAKMKHAIKDRQLWVDFERLMIRESYARTRADEELGVGNNAHIKIGDLRDRQSVKDHATNRRLLESIQARNPELIALRNRIFDFTRDELATRQRASVRDMLLKMGVAKSGDEVAISGFTKDIMRQNKTITAAERNAMDRVLRLGKENDAWKNWERERARIESSLGTADPAYKKHMARETKILTTLASREYDNYKKNRDDVRKVVDFEAHHGPHVPFMRHGNHAVYTEFHITPDPGVRYNEVKAADPNDLHKQYDFAKLEDAEKFIDETLGHEDVNITVTNAHEVVYDKATGEQAAHWTVEKPDRTAKTYTSREEAEAAREKGDTISKRLTTSKDIDQMRDNGQPTDHLEVRHRVVFNPTEFVKFESEREAHEYRDKLNRDSGHVSAPGLEMRTTRPRLEVKVSNVESAHEMVGRANVSYTSAEMKQWINRQEASPEYQRMDPSEQAEWSRKLRVQAAHVTATAGRRTAHMPREYARGASTDILKNMIEYAGSNSRAVADLTYRDAIDKGLEGAEAYVVKYRNQSGGLGKDHRARDDAMVEIKKRLFAPPRVEDSWATAIKRGLQVSMISHLADTGYLIVNAIEPWVFGAAITASRHGWAGAYREQIAASKLIDPVGLARAAGKDMAAAFRGEFGANPYENMLLASVRGDGNIRGDGERLAQMLQHMFDKGLAARDVGMEVERIHDPSANIALRGLDWMDNLFRGANTGIETFNRASAAVANYRLEYQRALKEVHSLDAAHEQAVRYAEDMVFKGAGDYGAWNNPRYFNNPFLKLAGQFKKYPLRIASVYADAMMGAVKGDPQKAKQLAYMLIAQSVAAGGMGLPLLSPAAGLINAAYILGLSDGNMDDAELWMRKRLVDMVGVDATDLAMHGALRFSGADFASKMSQSSFIFMGSPDSRKPGDLIKTVALALLGAPGNAGKKGLEGIQKIGEGIGDMSAGAETQGMTKGMEGMAGVMQIKFITNIAKAISMATGGPSGLPKGTEATGGEIAATALGFTPTSLADKRAAKRATNMEKKRDSEYRKRWTDRWLGETDPTRAAAVWAQIQKANQDIDDPRLRIKYEDLWKAKQRAKNEARRDDSKLGVKLSGRQKAFADTAGYFNV